MAGEREDQFNNMCQALIIVTVPQHNNIGFQQDFKGEIARQNMCMIQYFCWCWYHDQSLPLTSYHAFLFFGETTIFCCMKGNAIINCVQPLPKEPLNLYSNDELTGNEFKRTSDKITASFKWHRLVPKKVIQWGTNRILWLYKGNSIITLNS